MRDMEWSCKSMLLETMRCLSKTEADLSVDLQQVKAHVHESIRLLDSLPNKCTRCWGKGVVKCLLCSGTGELKAKAAGRPPGNEAKAQAREKQQRDMTCTRCSGTCLEGCPDCAGYGLA